MVQSRLITTLQVFNAYNYRGDLFDMTGDCMDTYRWALITVGAEGYLLKQIFSTEECLMS